MDLNVSPDIEAYYCYGIVLVLGAWTAFRQVSLRLGGIQGIWLVPRTWLLFLAYVAVPLGLFWLLDRTGAINDTSFFAAILVGVGYERIITGGSEALQAPGEASRFWTPFLAYADSVARLVREQIARNQARLDDQLIAEIVENPEKYQALEALARSRSSDMQNLEAQLAAIDQTAGQRGAADLLERKARLLYGILLAIPDSYYLLYTKKIISPHLYWFSVKRVGKVLQSALVPVVLVVMLVFGFGYLKREGILADYYVWRLGKINTTSHDQYRARRRLLTLIDDKVIDPGEVTRSLVILLRRPGLPMERVDLVLQTMLESSTRPRSDAELPFRLVESLRSPNVDARAHIHEVLIHLGYACKPPINKDDWQLPKGDATVPLEELIGKWSAYWRDCRDRTGSPGGR